MGIPYLRSDESIILSTHNVLIDAVLSEVILTSRHLLIVDSGNTRFQHKEIPFAAIATVTTGEGGSGDPAMSLDIRVKSGGTQPMQLVFSQQLRSQRSVERDQWVQMLKEQIALLPQGTSPAVVDLTEENEEKENLIGSSMKRTAGKAGKHAPSAAGSDRKTPPSDRFKSTRVAKKMYIMTTFIAIIIIIVIAGIVFLPSILIPAKNSVPSTPAPTFEVTTVPITTPATVVEITPLSTATPDETSVPQPTAITTPLIQTIIPANGIWVRIGYEGKYSGTIGTGGRLREVSGTGDRLYQVPARSTDIIEIYIQKLDTTGLTLTIEVFNNGEMIKRKSIITPKGTLIITVDLKQAQIPVITPAVTT
jgi:hypothetical protein